MSQVKPRTIRISDTDWKTTEEMATYCHMTPSEYIRLLLHAEAIRLGKQWEGVNKEGRPTKAAKE